MRHRIARYTCVMPLIARRVDRAGSHTDNFVVLSGGLAVGSFPLLRSVPGKPGWPGGCSLDRSATSPRRGHGFPADECKQRIAAAFRKMLANADLRERPDVKPPPPCRESVEAEAIT